MTARRSSELRPEASGDPTRRPAAARTVSTQQVDRAVTAHVSHFDRRDAIQAVANTLPNGAPAHEVEQLADAFLASESVIRIAESPKGERFTTQPHLGAGARGAGDGRADAGAADRVPPAS